MTRFSMAFQWTPKHPEVLFINAPRREHLNTIFFAIGTHDRLRSARSNVAFRSDQTDAVIYFFLSFLILQLLTTATSFEFFHRRDFFLRFNFRVCVCFINLIVDKLGI